MLASFLASLGRIRSPIPEPHVYRKLSHPELAMKIGPSSCMVPVQTRLRGGCDWPVVMAVFRCRDQPRLRTLVETSCVSNSRCRCRCKRLHGERTHPATKSKGEWAPAAVQPRCSVASHQRRAAQTGCERGRSRSPNQRLPVLDRVQVRVLPLPWTRRSEPRQPARAHGGKIARVPSWLESRPLARAHGCRAW